MLRLFLLSLAIAPLACSGAASPPLSGAETLSGTDAGADVRVSSDAGVVTIIDSGATAEAETDARSANAYGDDGPYCPAAACASRYPLACCPCATAVMGGTCVTPLQLCNSVCDGDHSRCVQNCYAAGACLCDEKRTTCLTDCTTYHDY